MSLSNALRFRVLTRDRFTCVYCGRRAPDVALEVDHVTPVARGGRDEETNLVTACFSCNRGKRDRLIMPRLPDRGAVAAVPAMPPWLGLEHAPADVPNPDRCSQCVRAGRGRLLSPCYGETNGVALYRCAECGHVWQMSGALPRVPVQVAREIVRDFNTAIRLSRTSRSTSASIA